MADLASNTTIEFPDLGEAQTAALANILGNKVTLANPLDYHTYIWGDVATMTACFCTVMQGEFDLVVFVLDIPREDICEPVGHDCAIQAIIAARQQTGANVAVLGMLPENLNEAVSARFLAAGVVPLHGMETGLAAIDAAIRSGQLRTRVAAKPVLLSVDPQRDCNGQVLTEYSAMHALQNFGLAIPGFSRAQTKDEIVAAVRQHNFPLALKGLGIAHKTEAGAVILGIETLSDLGMAIDKIPDCPEGYLIEEMVSDIIAELLVGVTRDELGLMLLTIGAGGVLAEIMTDTVSLLLPAERNEVRTRISELNINRILNGYRGKPAADIEAVLDAVEAVGEYVEANLDDFAELDINPLAVSQRSAVAVDALIRLRN
ncbi:MAG: hypothetical protein HKN85_11295 [Gammaproteobacteria bacterium]|nr:hypothetical protein [Gammaproteobacteria bacterium]